MSEQTPDGQPDHDYEPSTGARLIQLSERVRNVVFRMDRMEDLSRADRTETRTLIDGLSVRIETTSKQTRDDLQSISTAHGRDIGEVKTVLAGYQGVLRFIAWTVGIAGVGGVLSVARAILHHG